MERVRHKVQRAAQFSQWDQTYRIRPAGRTLCRACNVTALLPLPLTQTDLGARTGPGTKNGTWARPPPKMRARSTVGAADRAAVENVQGRSLTYLSPLYQRRGPCQRVSAVWDFFKTVASRLIRLTSRTGCVHAPTPRYLEIFMPKLSNEPASIPSKGPDLKRRPEVSDSDPTSTSDYASEINSTRTPEWTSDRVPTTDELSSPGCWQFGY